jgi:hypothetical protein
MNDDTRDLLAAWALDAVDDDERAHVEGLLDRDPVARADADDLREIVAHLALADHATYEPIGGEVWDRIVAATGATPGETAVQMATALDVSSATSVLPLRARRTRSRWLFTGGAVAAAALLFAIGVAVGSDKTPTSQTAWSYAERNGRTVVLTNNAVQLARIAVLPDGTGVVHNDALPALPQGKTYQLWAVVGDATKPTVISAGVLGPAIDDAPISFVGAPSQFVLTVEDVPGVAVSQQVATAAGTLS